MISMLMPRFASRSAATMASAFIHETPTTVTSLPARNTRPLPMGIS
jgi:hypothetical protein